MELFEEANKKNYQPLAARMRPRHIDEYVGQEHIIGPGRLLRRAIQADRLSSLIFYGPPGTGKTTLAQVIANTTKSHFTTMNAVLSGVKDLRTVIAESKERRSLYDKRTILFVDEVHRWNKSQQDALLPWVENGTVILIGATTENPFFEVNKALVSRSRIFQLKPLAGGDLERIAEMALKDAVRGFGKKKIIIDKKALEHIVHVSNGDARSLLNALELAVETTPGDEKGSLHISLEIAEQSIQEKAVLYDKEGDYHFDIISAFIKSIRGSDPDAVLYWLAKMIQAGESPHFIFRRMLISACEDIGLANPQAIAVVESNAAAFDRIGLPEGRFHLTHAALYLATSPKSNSCMAIFDALNAVMQENESEVPDHLRDNNRDGAAFGHGEGYLYPHAYRDHWVAQQYLPHGLQGKVFYSPSDCGYEADIKESVELRREIQLSVVRESHSREVLTFSPPDRGKERWLARIEENRSRALQTTRIKIFEGLAPARHHRILDINAGNGFLLWEALRRVPEGGVWALTGEETGREIIKHYIEKMADIEKPVLIPVDLKAFLSNTKTYMEEGVLFDSLVGSNAIGRLEDKSAVIKPMSGILATGAGISISEILAGQSTRLSGLPGVEEYSGVLEEAEAPLFSDRTNPLVNWDEKDLITLFQAAGFKDIKYEITGFSEERLIRKADIIRWFNPESDTRNYGTLLKNTLGEEKLSKTASHLSKQLSGKKVPWERKILFITAWK